MQEGQKEKHGTVFVLRVLCASRHCRALSLLPLWVLGGDVDPEPAQQRPVHPGSGVDSPAALRQQQRQSQSSQGQQRRQGSAEAEGGRSALPGEPGQLLRILRFVETLQQPEDEMINTAAVGSDKIKVTTFVILQFYC